MPVVLPPFSLRDAAEILADPQGPALCLIGQRDPPWPFLRARVQRFPGRNLVLCEEAGEDEEQSHRRVYSVPTFILSVLDLLAKSGAGVDRTAPLIERANVLIAEDQGQHAGGAARGLISKAARETAWLGRVTPPAPRRGTQGHAHG